MTECMQCGKTFIEQLNITNLLRQPNNICEECLSQWHNAKINNTNHCKRCLKSMINKEVICKDCLYLMGRYTLMNQLYCQYNYSGVAKEIIQRYKFMKDYALKHVIAQKLSLPEYRYDYIIPIPSPIERDKARTFNTVTTILDEMNVTYFSCVEVKNKLRQSTLTKKERAQQPNPFEINTTVNLSDKYILLVDDVYTTGITVHQVACKFFVRKIRKFDVFTFAR